MNWVAGLLTLGFLVAHPHPAYAGPGEEELIEAKLQNLAGQTDLKKAWGNDFASQMFDWFESDSKIIVALESGNEFKANEYIDHLIIRQLESALTDSATPLWKLAGLYSVGSRYHFKDYKFINKYASIRERVSLQYSHDSASYQFLQKHYLRVVDFEFLTKKFAWLPFEQQVNLFVTAMLSELDTLGEFHETELKQIWEVLELQLQTDSAKARFADQFERLTLWMAPNQFNGYSLNWEVRNESRLVWFRDVLWKYFPEDSYYSLKLKLFSELDATDGLSREGIYDLIRRFFASITESNHNYSLELNDPVFRNLVAGLDFDRAFEGFPELKTKVLRHLAGSVLSKNAPLNNLPNNLKFWDRLIAAYSHIVGGKSLDDGIFSQLWRAYLLNSQAFDFAQVKELKPADIAKLKAEHVQNMDRVMGQHPDLVSYSIPAVTNLQAAGMTYIAVPPVVDEKVAGKRLSDFDLKSKPAAFCNLVLHSQN